MSAALDEMLAQFADMRESDVADVSAIEIETYPFPWTAGIFRDCLKANYRCRVLRLGGAIAAYGIIALEAGEAHILNLCVRPRLRDRGWGRCMLSHLLELARVAGAARAWLEVRRSNVAAMGLYGAAGFVEVGVRRGYYRAADGREDALVFALDLGGAGAAR